MRNVLLYTCKGNIAKAEVTFPFKRIPFVSMNANPLQIQDDT